MKYLIIPHWSSRWHFTSKCASVPIVKYTDSHTSWDKTIKSHVSISKKRFCAMLKENYFFKEMYGFRNYVQGLWAQVVGVLCRASCPKSTLLPESSKPDEVPFLLFISPHFLYVFVGCMRVCIHTFLCVHRAMGVKGHVNEGPGLLSGICLHSSST